jgi:plastocyanin
MNTKLLASIAVFALLAGVISTSMMQSAYAADYGMGGNAADKKAADAKKLADKKAADAKKLADKKAADAKKLADKKATGKAAAPDAVTVEMAKNAGSDTSCADKCYIPSNVQVKVGGTVTWKNVDSAAHYATSGKDATSDGIFDSGMVMAGKTYKHTFDKAGTYDYFCMVHPWMIGKVTVS